MNFLQSFVAISSNENLSETQYINNIKSKSDILASLASSVDVGNQNSTSLMVALERDKSFSNNLPLSIISMQIQAISLPEPSRPAFVKYAIQLFNHLTKDSCLQFYNEVGVISFALSHHACKLGLAKAAAKSLKRVALLSAPNPNCLTSIHADFLQVSIKAKFYSIAIDFIKSNEILEVDSSKTIVDPQSFLRYFYYSGICFIGLKDFRSAFNSFLYALTVPSEVLSLIMVQALYKCKIVSLLIHGKDFSPKKNIATSLLSVINDRGDEYSVYDEISSHYVNNQYQSLTNCITNNQALLTSHGNFGLAQQLLDHWKKTKVEKIASTYLSINRSKLLQLTNATSFTEVENFILQLVNEKKILANLDDSEFIKFSDAHPQESLLTERAKYGKSIESSLQEINLLSDKLNDVHRQILTSTAYIMRSTSTGKSINSPTFWG